MLESWHIHGQKNCISQSASASKYSFLQVVHHECILTCLGIGLPAAVVQIGRVN
jgi:hypothetical protein